MTEEVETTSHWVMLGIAPTSDAKLIRRAYGQLLKSIDIDKDPHAFIALRSAYECALSESAPPPPPAFGTEPKDGLRDTETGLAEYEAEDAILSLLRSNDGRTQIAPQLNESTETVVSRSRLCSLSESEAIETWLADTIVSGIPRSNAMLGPAIKGFRWSERVDAYDCPEAIRFIVARHEDLEALHALQRLNPDIGLAWSALTEGGVDFETVHLGCMATLLGIVQYRHPHLIDDIDIGYFQRWTDHLDAARAAERLELAVVPPDLPPSRHPTLETAFNVALLLVGLAIVVSGVVLVLRSPNGVASGLPALLIFGVIGGFLIATARDRQSRLKR